MNEASVEKFEPIDPTTLPIDSERSAVKVSMIKRNNEIIYQREMNKEQEDSGVPKV